MTPWTTTPPSLLEKPKCRRDADLTWRRKRTQEPLLAQSSLFGQTRVHSPEEIGHGGKTLAGRNTVKGSNMQPSFLFFCFFLAGQVTKENPFFVSSLDSVRRLKQDIRKQKTQCLKRDTRSQWQQAFAQSLIRISIGTSGGEWSQTANGDFSDYILWPYTGSYKFQVLNIVIFLAAFLHKSLIHIPIFVSCSL